MTFAALVYTIIALYVALVALFAVGAFLIIRYLIRGIK